MREAPPFLSEASIRSSLFPFISTPIFSPKLHHQTSPSRILGIFFPKCNLSFKLIHSSKCFSSSMPSFYHELFLDINLLSLPFAYIRSGNYNGTDSATHGESAYGHFWSRRLSSDTSSRRLTLGSSLISPATSRDKNNGFTVRSLAKRRNKLVVIALQFYCSVKNIALKKGVF